MAWDGMDARGGDKGSGKKKKAATDHLTIKQVGVGNQQLISQGGRYIRKVLLTALDARLTASAQVPCV